MYFVRCEYHDTVYDFKYFYIVQANILYLLRLRNRSKVFVRANRTFEIPLKNGARYRNYFTNARVVWKTYPRGGEAHASARWRSRLYRQGHACGFRL